jgi:hypothetical protein
MTSAEAVDTLSLPAVPFNTPLAETPQPSRPLKIDEQFMDAVIARLKETEEYLQRSGDEGRKNAASDAEGAEAQA